MHRSRSMLIVLFSLSLAAFTFADEEADGPAEDVPQLKVLQHWVGIWDDEMAIKPSAALPDGLKATAVVTAKWVLGGRFVQQNAVLVGDNGEPLLTITTLMTYDPANEVYRSWTFMSNGTATESEGRWDEKARTMTSKRIKPSDGSGITTATFDANGVERWTIIEKDPDGNVVSDISGKNVPRKKK